MQAHLWEVLIGFLWTAVAFVAGIATHWLATREQCRFLRRSRSREQMHRRLSRPRSEKRRQ